MTVEAIADSLESFACICGGKMEQVISCAGERNIRAGWYCIKCRRWINAIGRERILDVVNGK